MSTDITLRAVEKVEFDSLRFRVCLCILCEKRFSEFLSHPESLGARHVHDIRRNNDRESLQLVAASATAYRDSRMRHGV